MIFEETKYGFKYGAAEIIRIHSDEKAGWIILSVKSPKQELQVYVTKTGKIRVWNHKTGAELKPAPSKILLPTLVKTKEDLEDWNRAQFETENQ